MSLNRKWAGVALPLLLVAAPAGAARGAPAVERARYLMGTVCTVHAEAPDSAEAAAAAEAALAAIDRLENVLSSWRPTSELARVNAAAGGPGIECSPALWAVLDSSLAVARATDGAFDPTIEPLDQAWDLRGTGRIPNADELDVMRDRVGWRKLTVDASARRVHFESPGMGLDFGGIGKGYALDRAADTLLAGGVTRALLNFGGELRAVGAGAPWPVQVADPLDRLRPALELPLAAGALSVSSQGERHFEVQGHRIGHIVDPRTGRPLDTRAAVAVLAASGTRADGLSTALLVLGRDGARRFAAAHREIGVLWLERQGRAVRAWRWNVSRVRAARGVTVRWQP